MIVVDLMFQVHEFHHDHRRLGRPPRALRAGKVTATNVEYQHLAGHNRPRPRPDKRRPPRYPPAYQPGRLKLDELITNRYRLDQINEG
jgi:hypothetical protein